MSALSVDPSTFTFLHLTDLHLLASPTAALNGILPVDKVRRVLARINELEIKPAFVLISGDLVNNGQALEYATLLTLLPELQTLGVPLLLGLGNHDDRAAFRQVVLGEQNGAGYQPYYHSTQINGLNVIMLDSSVPHEVHGYLDPAQLAWLATELTRPVTQGHLIVLHHPPVPCTVTILNSIMLTNPAEFAAVIAPHANVLGVLSGHIHYNHVTRFANTISFTTPAVFYGIDPGVQQNLRTLDNAGFAIGTVNQGQLFMRSVMIGDARVIAYQQG